MVSLLILQPVVVITDPVTGGMTHFHEVTLDYFQLTASKSHIPSSFRGTTLGHHLRQHVSFGRIGHIQIIPKDCRIGKTPESWKNGKTQLARKERAWW